MNVSIYCIAALQCKVCLMFIKSGHLDLTYVFPNIVMVRALDFQSSSPGFKTAGWCFHPSESIK